VGAPANVLMLAHFWNARNRDRRLAPKAVLLSTDHVPLAISEALESLWGCKVYNHYGMTEMGLGGGVECQARMGYHLREADLYFEIIDPLTGQPVAADEPGEVVFTTLTRAGMPLIRYRTGDLSRFISGSCPCGTCLPRLEKVTRRLDGRVTFTAGGPGSPALYLADLDEALFGLPGVLNFSASLDPVDGAKDRLKLRLVVMPGADRDLTEQALFALETIPAIRAAWQAEALELRIGLQAFDPAAAGSLAKRVITDHRGASHA
jgi:phenylacetate-CoA ligase